MCSVPYQPEFRLTGIQPALGGLILRASVNNAHFVASPHLKGDFMSTLASVMSKNPVSCELDTPIREVARMMGEANCGQIPVVDAGMVPVGVITDRDIVLRALASRAAIEDCCARDVMSSPALTVSDHQGLPVAVALMESRQIRRVPVVNAAGALVGMVSVADIANAGGSAVTAEVIERVSASTRSSG
jgi:CBS domain-containing protein